MAFVAIFMSTFDCEIAHDSLVPEYTRVGLATRQPKGKLLVKMKLAGLDKQG